MSSRFWNFITTLIPGQTARSEQVNAQFEEVEAALEKVALEMNRALRVPEAVGSDTPMTLPYSTGQRANKALGFDAVGTLTVANLAFTWRGAWTAGVFYAVNDVVQAPAANHLSLCICTSAHTSGTFGSDPWALMIDLLEVRRSLVLHQLVTGPQPSYALAPGQDVMVNVTGGPVSLVLPPNPLITDQPINIMHVGGPIADSPITILGNGKLIMALNEPLIVNTANASFGLAFCNDTFGWRIRGV